jgi:hypothetical protein
MSVIVLTPLEHIRALEKSLFTDIHCKVFNIHDGDDLTIVIADIVRWIVTDPKYGLMANVYKSKDQQKNILEVLSLYEEWIRTGVKPSKDRWEESQQKVNTNAELVKFYKYVAEEVTKKGIPYLEIRQVQYDYIQESIYKYSNSALFSFDDYEKDQ